MPSFCYDVYPYLSITGSTLSFSKFSYFMMLVADIFVYGILYLYLDEVLPNEYGTHKHPLFFLGIKNEHS